MNNLLRYACLLALLALLAITAACGNKGPLVLAEPPQAEAADAPAGEVPVELAPEATTAADPASDVAAETLDDTATDETTDAPPVGAKPAEPPAPIPGAG